MKKLSLLLASIGAGLLLVGGTVAAYIVTAADPANVRISPGSIQTDEYGRVVLSWGSNTLHTVQNLESGVETNVGEVVLASEYTKKVNPSDPANYTGTLKATITNAYAGTHDLIDDMNIFVYKGSATSPVITLGSNKPSASVLTGSVTATATESYRVTAKFLADAGTSYYDELLDQSITLTLEWGALSGSTDIDSRNAGNVYFSVATQLEDNEALYAYIYEGSKVAAGYPGVKMTYEYQDINNRYIYSAPFNLTEGFKHFRFIKGTTVAAEEEYAVLDEGVRATAFVVDDPNPYFDGENFVPRPNRGYTYYFRGTINGVEHWDSTDAFPEEYAFKIDGGDPFVIIEFAKDDVFKLYDRTRSKWLWDGDNYKINDAGRYTICADDQYHDGWTQAAEYETGHYYYYWIGQI